MTFRSIPVKQVTQQKLTVGHWNLFHLRNRILFTCTLLTRGVSLNLMRALFWFLVGCIEMYIVESKGPFGKCLHKHTRQFSTSNMCRADYICGISWPPWLRYEWYLLIWPTGKTLKCIREEVTLWFEPSQSNCETFSGHERALTKFE